MEDRRKDDASQRYSMPPRVMRFRPCTKTERLGSYAARKHAVGSVRRKSARPGIGVGFSPSDCACAAILRANSLRISIAAASRSLCFSVCFATSLCVPPYLSVLQNYPCVHEIRSLNRIRQRIGRIGKASERYFRYFWKCASYGESKMKKLLSLCLLALASAQTKTDFPS